MDIRRAFKLFYSFLLFYFPLFEHIIKKKLLVSNLLNNSTLDHSKNEKVHY